jgi:hypothetical protein
MCDMKFSGPYGEYEIDIKMSKYTNGQHRMDFIDIEDGFPVLVASVSIQENISSDEIAIKDYSENEGVLKFLMEKGIVSSPLKYFNSGFVRIPLCKLMKHF